MSNSPEQEHSQKPEPQNLTQSQIQADLFLLKNLWIYINTDRMRATMEAIETGIRFDVYENHILQYLELRTKAENRFI